MRNIDEIIIHCSATRPEWMDSSSLSAKIDEIRRWHVKGRGWSDIGYHYLIDRDGAKGLGRPVTRTGAHVRGHNTGSIGVCLIGGHGSSEDDDFLDNFTIGQDRALRELLGQFKRSYGTLKISGHNEYAAKACPGFNVGKWYASAPATELGDNSATSLLADLRALVDKYS